MCTTYGKENNPTESRNQENFEPSAPPIHQIYQPITITEQYLQHHRQYLQDSQNMTAVYSVDSETNVPRFTTRNSEFDPPPSYDQIFSLNHFPSESSEIKPTALQVIVKHKVMCYLLLSHRPARWRQ